MNLINSLYRVAFSVGIGCAFFNASAQLKPEIPTQVTFSRTIVNGAPVDRVKETYSWGTQTLPAHRISRPNAGFLHHTFATDKIPGATTQELKFRFKSNGTFSSNPGAHFFAMVRSESTGWYNRGKGLIVGGLNATANPCPSGITSQPETWFINTATGNASNYVWGGASCGSQLSENVWYDVFIHVADSNWFAYQIKNPSGQLVANFAIQDTANQENFIINNKLSGFAFGLVFADNNYQAWTLEFDNIQVKWF